MSCVYFKQRKYDEALALYNTSLEIFVKMFGPDHPEHVPVSAYVGSSKNLKDLKGTHEEALELRGKHEEALDLRKKSQAIKMKWAVEDY
ncbi:hypothetical protein T484DRAFT_1800123 [Baffinella frigidus]|nr:hypothetical protein T484DRAFT_1800123 [Cryptophyta sp. CCMP2293]